MNHSRHLWTSWEASLGAFGLFFVLWLVPPVVHQYLHYCPIRPDGLNQAEAVPAFARKYGVSCSQCHTAFPTLNAYGREFKLNGYVRSKGSPEGVLQSQDGGLWIEKLFPLSVIVRSRPYDKSSVSDSEFKMQAVRDIDAFIAGGDAGTHVSFFGELDANADTSPSFSVNAGDLQLGYHPYRYLNVIAARRGFFVMDPYQTLSNFGSPTVANRAIAGGQTDQAGNAIQGSLSGDTMDETKQTIAVNGQISQDTIGSLYYAIGASADKGDDAGKGPKDGNLRLAFSTLRDSLMIGTFGSSGSEGSGVTAGSPVNRVQFNKTGVDTLVEVAGFAVRGAFLYTYDKDLTLGTRETNRSAYGEVMYVWTRGESDAPFLVPLIRQNWFQNTNGTEQFAYFTAQVAHYFRSNVKAFIEWSADTKQDITPADSTTRQPKGNRLTTQIEVGF